MTSETAGYELRDDGFLDAAHEAIPEPVLRPGFLRRLVAAVAAWWRG